MFSAKQLQQILLALFLIPLLYSCGQHQPSAKAVSDQNGHPEWTKDANIYEVNIRQYTPEGTFSAFQKHLPRLESMGVEILWLMPIHPIGKKRRKGKLGSYYSIRNYKAINPDFGTEQDFKQLVDAVHERGMKLIIDWVPNHTAWDHPWVQEHPEFYAKDSTGAITYEADWTDIALLNYDNKELWPKIIDAMGYWVSEADIDGFRVDHAAHEIPMAFWERAIPKVNNLKKGLFWLAEWNDPKLHPLFDASYTWDYFHLATDIAQETESVDAITEYMQTENALYPKSAYRMYFTTNHDENSWKGTDQELYGDNFENFAVMAATIDGIPLIYSGQETGLDQRLEFFKKDTIDWDGYEYETLYHTLLELKKNNSALWNGQYGGGFEVLQTNKPEVYAFRRVKGEDEVVVILNFSDKSTNVQVAGLENKTNYRNVFKPEELVSVYDERIILDAHQYLVLEK